jgi:hypothetical protein
VIAKLGGGPNGAAVGPDGSVRTAFVAYGRCDALFTPRVLGPVHDIASRLGDNLQAKLESGERRSAAFTAFLDALRKLRAPVIVFEDVHWADDATLDLIKFLGRRIGDTRALLILTYRDDELTARHPLRLVLGELPRECIVRVPLVALSVHAVGALVTPAKAGPQFDPATLHRITNGNPFYLTEILASGGGVPESVRDAVLDDLGGWAAGNVCIDVVFLIVSDCYGYEGRIIARWFLGVRLVHLAHGWVEGHDGYQRVCGPSCMCPIGSATSPNIREVFGRPLGTLSVNDVPIATQ